MSTLRRPFWLPASNYYVLSIGVAVAFFFGMWGLLDDEAVRAPWQTAGVGAGILLVGAVIFRELILRRLRSPYLKQPSARHAGSRHPQKLTAERAAEILKEIRRKSDAADVLGEIPSGHQEVFHLCDAFLRRIDTELPSVQAGSPRLAALLKGRTKATALHRHHMLRWAEVATIRLSNDARNVSGPAEREQALHEALEIVDQALLSYPIEPSLRQSRALLLELAVSVTVGNLVEQAEQAAFRSDIHTARSLYGDALLRLGGADVQTPERERAARRIREAIERLSISNPNR
jgi:hypothetical protein